MNAYVCVNSSILSFEFTIADAQISSENLSFFAFPVLFSGVTMCIVTCGKEVSFNLLGDTSYTPTASHLLRIVRFIELEMESLEDLSYLGKHLSEK